MYHALYVMPCKDIAMYCVQRLVNVKRSPSGHVVYRDERKSSVKQDSRANRAHRGVLANLAKVLHLLPHLEEGCSLAGSSSIETLPPSSSDGLPRLAVLSPPSPHSSPGLVFPSIVPVSPPRSFSSSKARVFPSSDASVVGPKPSC